MTKNTQEASAVVPIVYSPAYNIVAPDLQAAHPFDMEKFGRVYEALEAAGFFKDKSAVVPAPVSDEDLKLAHSKDYLKRLEDPKGLSEIFEVEALKDLPLAVIQDLLLTPVKHQAGGTVLAGELALEHGWAINLGGGYHHASYHKGEGFCAIADISLSVQKLRTAHPEIENVMIIDLDAHQGNGHERDFREDKTVYTVDLYNNEIYPMDGFAKAGINVDVGMPFCTKTDDYLSKLAAAFNQVVDDHVTPDVIYYVAGTDILERDPLGSLLVSKEGVIKRDEMVFDYAQRNNTPIVMMLAGGYQPASANVISESIQNLNRTCGWNL